MPHTALFHRWRDHFDVAEVTQLFFKGCEAGGVNTIVIGQQDPHRPSSSEVREWASFLITVADSGRFGERPDPRPPP